MCVCGQYVCVYKTKKWWEVEYCLREDAVKDIRVTEVQLPNLSRCSQTNGERLAPGETSLWHVCYRLQTLC